MTLQHGLRVAVVDAPAQPTILQRVGVGRAVLVALVFCVVVTSVMEASDFDPTLGTRRFHVALETADALVLIFLAAVLTGRFRSDGSLRNLVLAAAVTVLAVKNGYYAISSMFVQDPLVGTDPIVWGTALSGVLGATLLATAALLRDRQIGNSPLLVGGVILAGAAVVIGLDLLAGAVHEGLPQAFPVIPEEDEAFVRLDRFSGHPLKIAIDLGTALAYAIAALGFTRLADRYRDDVVGWMAVGSAIASCAFIYYAVVPSRFTELLYGGEILWLLAIVPLSYGAIAEISNLESGLVRSAVRAERKRVARDLHDGVVQELAYIATQKQWLLERVAGTTYEASVRRIGDSVDRALDESRGAIAALNRELDESLALAVTHAARDVADRFGVRLVVDADPRADAHGEWRDALIRIAREAVGNAARHGGASEVRVTLAGSPLVLTLADDGRGFDPSAPRSAHSFGLQSMRERAESLGGDFAVASHPGGGTAVRVALPDGPGSAAGLRSGRRPRRRPETRSGPSSRHAPR